MWSIQVLDFDRIHVDLWPSISLIRGSSENFRPTKVKKKEKGKGYGADSHWS